MWISGRLISQLDHLNRAKDSWRTGREVCDTKRDEEDNWGAGGGGGGGSERHDGRQKGRNRHNERRGRAAVTETSPRQETAWLSRRPA